MSRCEGDCDEHIGEVVPVRVWWRDSDCEFDYCQAAIAEDRRRGFTVEVLGAAP